MLLSMIKKLRNWLRESITEEEIKVSQPPAAPVTPAFVAPVQPAKTPVKAAPKRTAKKPALRKPLKKTAKVKAKPKAKTRRARK